MDYLLEQHLTEDVVFDLKLLVSSFVVWNIVNLIVMYSKLPDGHLARNDMLDMRNRIVSCMHGTISIFLAAYNTYFLHSECGQKNTKFEEHILIFSCGYFFYDFLAMCYFGLMDASMFIHHFICMFGMAYCVISDISASTLIAALFVSEISNPAMHIRMVLKHLNKRYTKAYESAELMYIGKLEKNMTHNTILSSNFPHLSVFIECLQLFYSIVYIWSFDLGSAYRV